MRVFAGALLVLSLSASDGLAQSQKDPGSWALGDYSAQLEDCSTLESAGVALPEDYVDGTPLADRTCDAWQTDALERPVSSDQSIYYPGIDIERVLIGERAPGGNNPGWLFFAIDVADIGPTGSLNDFFGYELDTDSDTRGDFFVNVKSPKDLGSLGVWSQKQVAVYQDVDGSIGSGNPLAPDPSSPQNGYESNFWITGDRKTQYRGNSNAVWARIRLDDPTIVELAIDRQLLGNPEDVTVRGWVAKGLQSQSKDNFYLHDTQTEAEYGSPYPDADGFPPSALYQVDNSGPVGGWLASAKPSLVLTKTGAITDTNGDGVDSAGDEVAYTLTVQNDGNVTLSNVGVTDPLTGLNQVIASLAPGTASVISTSYILSQPDVDAGTLTNSATATVTYNGAEYASTADDVQTLDPAPSITLDKTASPSTYSSVDEAITYDYIITNTGNVTLAGPFSISDDRIAAVSDGIGPLAPGESVVVEAAYAITQADLDFGSVTNTASATDGSTTSNDASVTVTADLAPSVSLAKTGAITDTNGDDVDSAGDQVAYTLTVQNDGNVTLSDVLVTDPLTGLNQVIASLAPGLESAFATTYVVTQSDMDAGEVVNAAHAAVTYGGTVYEADASYTQALLAAPSLDLAKALVAVNGDALATEYTAVADVLTYRYAITNTGNVTLAGPFSISDDRIATVSDGIGPLAPGESVVVEAAYFVTQADLDLGSVINTASATDGSTTSDESAVVVNATATPSLVLTKTGLLSDTNGDGMDSAGDQVAYTLTVQNDGNVTLSDVVVTDPMTGLTQVIASLAPGVANAVDISTTYNVAQSDVDAGTLTNTATATVTYDGIEYASTGDDVQTLDPAPSIVLSKSGTYADSDGNTLVNAGDRIEYVFGVENTGNVSLRDVVLTDDDVVDLTALSGLVNLDSDGATDDLEVGATATSTASYVLTQADINAGFYSNAASVASIDPTGTPVIDSTIETVPIDQMPSLALVMTSTFEDENGDGFGDVGETISYDFTLTNTGNVTLTDIVVVSTSVIVSGGPLGSLAPGASDASSFSGSYALTQEDIDLGTLTNTATATGTYLDAEGHPQPASDVSDDDSNTENEPTVITIAQDPSLTLTRTGTFEDENANGVADVGESIAYTYAVLNTGNVTLTGVTVSDDLLGISPIDCSPESNPIVDLAPEEEATCVATYVLTAADIDAGEVTSTATADTDQTDPVDGSEITPLPTGISFVFNVDGLPGVDDGSDFADLGAALTTWEEVPGTTVDFHIQGTTTEEFASATDGMNLVTFRDTIFPFPPYVLAIASKTTVDGEVVDADVVFNPMYIDDPLLKFKTSISEGNVDIQSTMTHEVGHVVDMLHSGVPDATMFFQLQPGEDARTLDADDIAWIVRRHPTVDAYATLGSISGRVLDGDQVAEARGGVAGALLLAREAGGNLFHTYTDVDGNYSFEALPPGSYLVSVQPLDGDVGPLDETARYPMSAANVSAELRAITVNTTFIPEYFNAGGESDNPEDDLPGLSSTVAVGIGSETPGIDIITNADWTPPSVVGFIPADGAVVPSTTDIVISFSEPIAGGSLSFTFEDVTNGGGIGGELTLHNGILGIFAPDVPLSPGTTYRMTVGSGLTDQRGTIQDSSFTSSFLTTAPEASGFVVTFVGPEDVPGTAYAISTPIYADFSDPVDRSSVNPSSFLVSAGGVPVPGIFDFVNSDTRVVFRAPAGLTDETVYTVSISGIDNLDGDPVAPWSSTFETEGNFGPIISSAAPSAAVVGTLVTLGGKGFDPDPANNTVTIAGLSADVVNATLTGLTFVVPDTAPEGDTDIVVENLYTRDNEPGIPSVSASFPYTIVTGILLDNAAVARIVSESGSRDTDVSPDGALAYVTNSDNDWVTVVDLISLTAIGAPIPVGDTPLKIVVHPSGNTAYVTNFLSHTVSVIDLTANPPSVIDEIPVGLNPIGIAAAPDGSQIYVAEFTSQGVSVISADPTGGAYNQVVSRITTESSNRDVEVSPDGALAFITGDEGLAIVNLDPTQPDYNAVVARVSSETSTRDVDVSPDGALAFVTTEDGAIFVVDISPGDASFSVVARTTSESGARETEVSPDGALLFVTNYDGNSLDVYTISVGGGAGGSTAVTAPVTSLPPVVSVSLLQSFVLGNGTGENPEGLVFSPKSSILAVANSTSGTVSVFRFGDDPDVDKDGLLDRREALVGEFYNIIAGYGVNVDEELNKWRGGIYPGKSKDPRERILNQLLRALDSILKTLDPSYWLDAYHLDPMQGNKVFDNDRQVVQSLVAVLGESTLEAEVAVQVQGIIDEIIQIEIELVEILLDETTCEPGTACQRAYDSAVTDLDRARGQYAAGQFEIATKTLKSAWGSVVAYWSPVLARAGARETLLDRLDDVVEQMVESALPTEFALRQNFPNPFNPATILRFDVPEQSDVRVEVFDLLGRRVSLLVDGNMSAGYHEARFDATDLSSGIYLARMTAGGFTAVKRMVLVK